MREARPLSGDEWSIGLASANWKRGGWQDTFEQMVVILNGWAREALISLSYFEREMKRFLSQEAYERTLGKEKFREFLISNLAGLLTSAKKELSASTNNEPTFRF